MKLYNISLNSLKRKKTKTALLIFSLFLSVLSVITLLILSNEMQKNISHNLDEYGANILITPKTDEIQYSYGNLNLGSVTYTSNNLSLKELKNISKINHSKNISIVAPKLYVQTVIDGNSLMIAGVDFKQEIRIKKWWKINGQIPGVDDQILIGISVKKKNNLEINDSLLINEKKFHIAGFIESTGSQDDNSVFMSLPVTQTLFDKPDEITLAEVAALCYDCPIEEIVYQTSDMLPGAKVTALKQTIEAKTTAVNSFKKFSVGVSSVIMLISVLMVFSALNSSINERLKEIGVFRAVGMRGFEIVKIILTEITIASFVAALFASIGSFWITRLILPILTDAKDIALAFDYSIPVVAILLSISIAAISGIIPIYRAIKLDPAMALRTL
ncbi:MAG: ABC transporter permease [Bacteroidetes bacterium]|nr:ABC transporter permease [Bacteroidota bacterium]